MSIDRIIRKALMSCFLCILIELTVLQFEKKFNVLHVSVHVKVTLSDFKRKKHEPGTRVVADQKFVGSGLLDFHRSKRIWVVNIKP